MVIGIDGREAAGNPAGKGRYVQEMLKHLPRLAGTDQFICYVKEIPVGIELAPNARWKKIVGRGPAWHRRVAKAANSECDIYFSTTSYLTALFLKIPFVLFVHDLISFQTIASRRYNSWWNREERLLLPRAIKKARGVLTNSKATAADLRAKLPATAGKATVTPLAADVRFRPDRPAAALAAVRQKYELPESFVLNTGTIEPRKNLERLIAAHAALPASLRATVPLVLVGKRGWQDQMVFEAISGLKDSSQVRHLSYVSDEDLADLYAAATAFCYPSLYEGFGLPVLEAMQSGTPVLASNTPSLTEVGGDAIRTIDPMSTQEITAALQELLESPEARKRLSDAGRQRAKNYTWEQTARLTLKTIKQLQA